MDNRKNTRKSLVTGGPPNKIPRKRTKNGISKVKEEKHPIGGLPDPGGGSNGPLIPMGDGPPRGSQHYDTQSMDGKGLSAEDLLMNGGAEIKMENPSTPHPPSECPPDIPPLAELAGGDYPPDCKPHMGGYGNCYPPYNNNMPPNMQPGDFGPPHPHGPPMHGGPYGPGPGGMGPGPGPMNYPGGPPQSHPPPPHSQQPHPKQQPNTLDAPYMQQQSQLFVFDTKLANKAAEAVNQHQFASIIAFHTAQPSTRKFLEKHPFKNNNFGRQFQGNSNWPGPAAPPGGKMKGSKGQQQQPMPMPPNMPPGPPPPHNMPPDFNQMQGQGPPGAPWNTQNNSKLQHQGFPNYYDGPPYSPHCQQGGPPPPGCPGGGPQPPPGYFGGPPNMQQQGPMPPGIKIRDEDLTPQQRIHREEQLNKMRKLQEILLPEINPNHPQGHNVPGGPGDPSNFSPMPPHDNLDVYNMTGEPPPQGGGQMDYNMPGPGGKPPPGSEWSQGGPGGPGFLPPPGGMAPQGNNRPGKGGPSPSPGTPLTPCGGGPPRPSPHSPMSGGDGMYGGSNHQFYPSGYYSPQVGSGQENSPSAAVHRKDSESSNSEGGKSRKEKSSCSMSPTSSAPPSVKEANLMPVPSPQQIQYLNVFEGQELTIQKQPNVGLTEHSENSPGMPPDMNPSTPLGPQKPSQPPTPVSMGSSVGNNQKSSDGNSNSSAKNRPASVGPITPKNSTTPNPSPRGMDSTSQPGTPLQMNLEGMRNPSTSSAGSTPVSSNNTNSSMNNFGPNGPPPPTSQGMNSNGGPPSCHMMKQGIPPDGPVFDNVPLNPGPPGPPGKPAFDPISSMVQMSQQLTGGNGTPPNSASNNMGGSNGNYGMHGPPPGNGPMNPNMVNFHSVQNVDVGMGMGGATVNNTYVNATMTIQQMNIQNIPPYMGGPGPNQMGPNQMGHMGPQQMNHMPPMGGPMGPGQMPNSGPNNMNQIGPGGPGSMGGPGPGPMGQHMGGMSPMNMPPRGMPMGPGGYPNQGPPQRMQGPPGMGGPDGMGGMSGGPPGGPGRGAPFRPNGPPNGPRAFGGTNVQVKPNQPNTIQYLPARPPPPHSQGPGGMCSPNSMGGPGNGPPGRSGPNLEFLQRYTNPSSGGPVVNVNMGQMNVNVGMGNRMQYPPGPPPPGGMGGPPMGPMRVNGPPPMMEQGPGQMGGQMGGPQQLMGGPPNGPGGMKGPSQGYPPNGPGPGGPQPSPSDPAYAQQFHHFQQQLYATGSNNGRNPMQPNMPPNPNTPPNQQFFNY